MMQVYDNTVCGLGEGLLWHPLRGQLFWFDITGRTLYCRDGIELQQWHFDECVSAAGWVDRDTLLIASETALLRFDLVSGARTPLVALDADNGLTRSNDGRADPFGGFWIGTMGKQGERGAGAIYRYYRGELRLLVDNVSITNAICFAPDKSCAYYADTAEQIVWRQPLEPLHGWPVGERQLLLDLRGEDLNPDGAVCDAAGNLWIAQWGAARVAQYSPAGEFLQAVAAPTQHVTCPAFAGPGLNRLYVTSATQGLSAAQIVAEPAGQTLFIDTDTRGLAEYPVILE
ncbi:SMP-30/gluconolactonase/LRE family protein [Marinobacterium sedimentorum]|uniref:SMP-30/gluconolactonase/LRE family protein n=1 Tax=Marinobacterium sedimentorum TaxID=2927804 RepID=UPI0020C6291C|nr:SMP-30/gluconolactonase/LRE family protein [Marinobacterium sedimentorum]MCP8686374.1 SMP-30/gluconolactonase/LRE family protein [Marinobacterium sedimentorum]